MCNRMEKTGAMINRYSFMVCKIAEIRMNKWMLTVFQSLYHNTPNIYAWLNVDLVWTGWNLLISKEDVCSVGTNSCWFKVNAKRVVLVVNCLHRDVKATLVCQSDCNITRNIMLSKRIWQHP